MTRWMKRCGLGFAGVCVALLSAGLAFAGPEWDTTPFVVKKLQVYKDGRVWVHLNQNVNTSDENYSNHTACVNDTAVQITSSATTAGKELMMKVLVAAQLSGRPVKLRVEGENQVCVLYEITME